MPLHSEVKRRIAILESSGFRCLALRRHAAEYIYRGSEYFYLPITKKTAVALSPLTFSPSRAIAGQIGKLSFNSNFSTFPKKQNMGKAPERYGVAFDLEDDAQLLPFLKSAFGAL